MTDHNITNNKTGTLYGLGVGPGDPELITLKSVRILKSVDVVFAASSTKNSHSLAMNIARPHIPDTTNMVILSFPMTKDKNETRLVWEKHAHTISEELRQGKDAAFLTLGDPMTYSTFGYILKHIRILAPDIKVESIPGITSYQAAASRINTPLVEGEESLLIIPGTRFSEKYKKVSKETENIVILKAYRNIKEIVSALEDDNNLFNNCTGITNCGLPGEEIVRSIDILSNKQPNYWTLIIAKQKKENGTT